MHTFAAKGGNYNQEKDLQLRKGKERGTYASGQKQVLNLRYLGSGAARFGASNFGGLSGGVGCCDRPEVEFGPRQGAAAVGG